MSHNSCAAAKFCLLAYWSIELSLREHGFWSLFLGTSGIQRHFLACQLSRAARIAH